MTKSRLSLPLVSAALLMASISFADTRNEGNPDPAAAPTAPSGGQPVPTPTPTMVKPTISGPACPQNLNHIATYTAYSAQTGYLSLEGFMRYCAYQKTENWKTTPSLQDANAQLNANPQKKVDDPAHGVKGVRTKEAYAAAVKAAAALNARTAPDGSSPAVVTTSPETPDSTRDGRGNGQRGSAGSTSASPTGARGPVDRHDVPPGCPDGTTWVEDRHSGFGNCQKAAPGASNDYLNRPRTPWDDVGDWFGGLWHDLHHIDDFFPKK